MSVRMETATARKMNYKMMVSTRLSGPSPLYTHAHAHTHTLILFISLSLSLFPDPLSRSTATDGGCAVRARLAAYFAQLRRARERVLTWRATMNSRCRVHALYPSPLPAFLPPLFVIASIGLRRSLSRSTFLHIFGYFFSETKEEGRFFGERVISGTVLDICFANCLAIWISALQGTRYHDLLSSYLGICFRF